LRTWIVREPLVTIGSAPENFVPVAAYSSAEVLPTVLSEIDTVIGAFEAKDISSQKSLLTAQTREMDCPMASAVATLLVHSGVLAWTSLAVTFLLGNNANAIPKEIIATETTDRAILRFLDDIEGTPSRVLDGQYNLSMLVRKGRNRSSDEREASDLDFQFSVGTWAIL